MLRTYIDEDWGRQIASAMMADLKRGGAAGGAGGPEYFHVRVAARLLAALGQAMLYAATTDDPRQPAPRLDLRQAAEAVTGRSMAIHDCPPGHELVPVGGDIVAWARAILDALRDQLREGAWTFCPCRERHGQRETDTAVLAAVTKDLLFLPAA